MVKLTPRKEQNSFKAQVRLIYRTVKGEEKHQEYPISYELPAKEQFYSEKSLSEALEAYHFVSEIKYILRMAENYETKDEESDRKRLVEALQNLKKIAPESKKKEVEQMIESVDD